MKKRLTAYDRERIVKKVVKASFDKREAELKQDEHVLALRVRNSLLTRDERGVMDVLTEKMARMFHTGGYLYAANPEDSRDYVQLHFAPGVIVPHFMYQTTVVTEDAGLLADIKTWREQVKALAAEKTDFQKKTEGVVNGFSSAAKLLDHWPTLRELMGDAFFADKAPPATVPATIVNELDAVLQAGKPFEQVAA